MFSLRLMASALIACALLLGTAQTSLAVPAGGSCGAFVGDVCDKGLFCEARAGVCTLFAGGRCTRRPPARSCAGFRPVCGCDGKTYQSDCQRRAAGVSKLADGRCGAK
jgi:hypothetical protein